MSEIQNDITFLWAFILLKNPCTLSDRLTYTLGAGGFDVDLKVLPEKALTLLAFVVDCLVCSFHVIRCCIQLA